MSTIDPTDPQSSAIVVAELETISPCCRWTDGTWEELGGIPWNLLQNVHKHQAMLSNFLIRVYLEKKIKSRGR
jgi:hypothetical protein